MKQGRKILPIDRKLAFLGKCATDLSREVVELKKQRKELLTALKRAHYWLQGTEPGRAQYLGEVITKATSDD